MATIGYYEPALFIPENVKAPPPRMFSATAGHTGLNVIQRADIVVLAAGAINRAATNTAGSIAGYANAGENNTFQGNNAAGPNNPQLFGYSQVGTLLPADPGQLIVYPFQSLFLEINLSATTGWITGGAQQANIGQQVGLLLDATTNLFVADQTQANKVATVYAKAYGPNKGVNGDLGARVVIQFLASVLV